MENAKAVLERIRGGLLKENELMQLKSQLIASGEGFYYLLIEDLTGRLFLVKEECYNENYRKKPIGLFSILGLLDLTTNTDLIPLVEFLVETVMRYTPGDEAIDLEAYPVSLLSFEKAIEELTRYSEKRVISITEEFFDRMNKEYKTLKNYPIPVQQLVINYQTKAGLLEFTTVRDFYWTRKNYKALKAFVKKKQPPALKLTGLGRLVVLRRENDGSFSVKRVVKADTTTDLVLCLEKDFEKERFKSYLKGATVETFLERLKLLEERIMID